MTSIERSGGTPVTIGGVIYGMAGGGYRGCTPELDAVIREAADALAKAYGADIEIRFNSDRESGGAFVKTPDGRNASVGICASVVTAAARARWECHADEYDREAETGVACWGEAMTGDQRAAARELAEAARATLAGFPEGLLTVCAHVAGQAAGERAGELAGLPGWNPMPAGRGYHHGQAASVDDALARCLRFVPSAK